MEGETHPSLFVSLSFPNSKKVPNHCWVDRERVFQSSHGEAQPQSYDFEFYGDLVYKLRKIIGKNDFPYHFKKIIVRYKKIGYNINVMRQTACLVVNPIKVNSFAYLFNCTTAGRTSD